MHQPTLFLVSFPVMLAEGVEGTGEIKKHYFHCTASFEQVWTDPPYHVDHIIHPHLGQTAGRSAMSCPGISNVSQPTSPRSSLWIFFWYTVKNKIFLKLWIKQGLLYVLRENTISDFLLYFTCDSVFCLPFLSKCFFKFTHNFCVKMFLCFFLSMHCDKKSCFP